MISHYRKELLTSMENREQDLAAIEFLREQLAQLVTVSSLDHTDAKFIAWHNRTSSLFQRFLRPDSPHFITFRDLRFRGSVVIRRLPYNFHGVPPQTGITPGDRQQFNRACAIAEGCINGAIEEVRDFGIHSEQGAIKPTSKRAGGFQQNFHGPVEIHQQTIATDHAVQNIGRIGNTGLPLKEIAALIDQSLDLTGHQRLDALKAIELIATEQQKPLPHRNWKSIVDWGHKLLSICAHASDMATKLAPHLPSITALVHEASKR
ncbi:MAG TPA: hypothetical protein VIY69_19030 [Candidatus Acidoferrales bacterium]